MLKGELPALKEADLSLISKFRAADSDVFAKRSGALFSSTVTSCDC